MLKRPAIHALLSFLIFNFAFLIGEASASTIIFPLAAWNLSNTNAVTNSIRVTHVGQIIGGRGISVGLPIWLNTTNGLITNAFDGGNYSFTILYGAEPPYDQPMYFQSPGDTNTYYVTNSGIWISGGNFFIAAPAFGTGSSSNAALLSTASPQTFTGPNTFSNNTAIIGAGNNAPALNITTVPGAGNDAINATNTSGQILFNVNHLGNATFLGEVTGQEFNGDGSGITQIAQSGLSVTFVTNANSDIQSITISGATPTILNQTYSLYWLNTAVIPAQAVWTNANTTNFIYANDPGGNTAGTGYALESITNDANLWAFGNLGTSGVGVYWIALFGTSPTGNWNVNTAGGSPVGSVVNQPFISSYPSSLPISVTPAPTNIIMINGVTGNDINATLGLISGGFPLPYQTIINVAAESLITSNGYFNIAPGYYGDVGGQFHDNSYVNGNFAVFQTTNTQNTNANYAEIFIGTNSVLKNIWMTDGIIGTSGTADGSVFEDCFTQSFVDGWNNPGGPVPLGSFDCINNTHVSHWDAIALQSTSSNSVYRFFDCRSTSTFSPNTSTVGQGNHPLVWHDAGGGLLEVFGGSYNVLNGNISSTSGAIGDASIIVGGGASSSIASIVLAFPTLSYGGTNTGTEHDFVNSDNLPVHGAWLSISNKSKSVVVSSVFHVASPMQASSIVATNGITIGAFTNTATGTLIQTNFVTGEIYNNIYGRPISVSATVSLKTAAAGGLVGEQLLMSGYLTNQVSIGTISTSLVTTNFQVLSGIVPANQTYTFTNATTDGGTVTLLGGQILVQ